MTTMLALLAQGWTVDVRGSEVKVTGKGTVEFRRRVNRLEDGRLLSGLSDDVLTRTLDGAHVETFERPGPVELKANRDGKVFEATVRAGSAASVVAWAVAGMKRITAAAEGLQALNLKGERAKRRLAAWRASGEASELPAAGAALAALAGDVEHALAKECPMLSGMDGRPFTLDSLPERCAALIALAERERDLVILDALNGLAEDVHALAVKSDGGRWARAEAGFWRSFDHLKRAAGDGLMDVLAGVAGLIEIGAAAAECLGANEGELERRREALELESRRLEEALRS
ncbi:MAG TPA: hypothetical protein VF950_11355 [Planctomycetota bacterium]